jgi:hypothetical protein
MRFLTILVAILAGLYGGYWFIARGAVENGVDAFLQDLARDGWAVSYSSLATTGFPSRFDTTVTDLSLTHPANGVTWATPMFQVFALSYRPTRVIAIWPERQIITLPQDRLVITADGLRASAGVNVALSLPLDAVTVESGPMTIDSDRGIQVGLEQLLFAFRRAGPGPADYDLYLETTALRPPVELTTIIDPTGAMPAMVDRVLLDSQLALDQPIDRNMRGQIRITSLTLRSFQINWGDVSLSASGSLTIAPDGIPDGSIALVAENWSKIIDLALSAGVITEGVAGLIRRGATVLSGGTNTLQAPLTFKDGLMSLGPVPLGPAPSLN